jgi:hypothetical protein
VAALLLALALGAADPCVAADAAGRRFVTCFDPGNRVEAAAGWSAAAGDVGAARALGLSAALRWRGDRFGRDGAPEWLRDMAVLEVAARLAGGEAVDARATPWRLVLVRRLAEPFLLLPTARPTRIPFPLDVGMALQAGAVRWSAARRDQLEVEVVRSTLLLDVARHLPWLRRAALGPEVAWTLRLLRGSAPQHRVAPLAVGALDLLAESPDGLWVLALRARAGLVIRVPGGGSGLAEGALRLERVVLSVNDLPLALVVEAGGERGPDARRAEALLGLRLGLPR